MLLVRLRVLVIKLRYNTCIYLSGIIMSIRLPIGYSNFKEIVDGGFNFVDKSLLIKEVIEDVKAVLITRPRRFGKTLNMSMLHYFFDIRQDAAYLFKNLKIAQEQKLIADHQSQYPVIFLTFKDVKEDTYKAAYQKIVETIQMIYAEFSSVLLHSDKVDDFYKNKIIDILDGKAQQATIENSIFLLSKCLHDHYGKQVCILIDEYDTPVQMGYLNKYYTEIVGLFRNLLGAALKDNPYLFKAVLTGILRVSKESFFSGLNNLIVYSMLSPEYSDYFGFTESEVSELLIKYNLQTKLEEMRRWYNGYQMGDHRIYNPWSIVNCITKKGICDIYWINTSNNDLIKYLLLKSTDAFKAEFEVLLSGRTVSQLIDEYTAFPELETNESVVWSLFFMAGYLTVASWERTRQGPLCQLRIPNEEIGGLYCNIIEKWLTDGLGFQWYNTFINHLLDGDVAAFEAGLTAILEKTVSMHDFDHAPESFYHGLLIGLTAGLYGQKGYQTKSNRESGYGRYDYMILSHLPDKPTILFEFKKVNLPKKKSVKEIKNILEKSAKEALAQIDTLGYLMEAKQQGANNILKIGLAFCGKRFALVYQC